MSGGDGGGEERLATYLSSLLKEEATGDIHFPVFSLNGSSL